MDWDLSEIVFGDPVAKQAARQSVQTANRKQALEKVLPEVRQRCKERLPGKVRVCMNTFCTRRSL